MADKTGIEWTEATWNPIAGCSIVSPGCTNCYAMREAGRWLRCEPKFAGLTQPSKAGPVWTGEVRLWEKALDQPLRWKTPRRIFVNSMSDLFHEAVPDEWIDRVFGVMAVCKHHRFQVLTKRADRPRRTSRPRLGRPRRRERPARAADGVGLGALGARSVRHRRRAVFLQAVGRVVAARPARPARSERVLRWLRVDREPCACRQKNRRPAARWRDLG